MAHGGERGVEQEWRRTSPLTKTGQGREQSGSVGQRLAVPSKIVTTNLWSDTLYFIELTVPWEDATEEANERKRLWNAEMANNAHQQGWKALVHPVGMIFKERQRMLQQREKNLEELRVAVESHKRSADTAEDSERIFIDLLRSIENIRFKVTQRIREQEKSAVSRAEGFIDRLEQEIDDLKRRDSELELLSCTHDHIHFLKSFQSLSEHPESTDVPSITVSSLLTFDDVGKSVFQLKEKLEDFCREEIDKISGRVTYIEIIPTNEPKIREEFLQYSSQFTLDPNTVNEHLRLSVWNRVFNIPNVVQQYPDHPERFDNYPQVLCRESVCGGCYWELEWNGDDGVEISVIGVYVDHSAGTLSFYSVSDTMTLIHRVQTTFTQPLYPGVWGSWWINSETDLTQ
ncbi:Tripartite motif-containing protein 16-like protein [Anabarilius grahami]|uniref:Tripartite motif-containing protein 16-like protein n=1 Tax=Anabarilius grahami TaxID=495550 RepID=A0A3N0Y7Y1_ANAGA|nr:Tripartite motif-containing protein 16-like protein [Anabarilius grahami]